MLVEKKRNIKTNHEDIVLEEDDVLVTETIISVFQGSDLLSMNCEQLLMFVTASTKNRFAISLYSQDVNRRDNLEFSILNSINIKIVSLYKQSDPIT
jgi:hypothetical protein